MSKHVPTSEQIRGALAMLRWDNSELAELAGISVDTVLNIKMDHHEPQARIRAKIKQALESHGIEFLDSTGIRRKSQNIEIFEGIDRFSDFTEFVYRELLAHGGDVCISAVDETLFRQYRKDFELYKTRMKELVDGGKVTVRIIATNSTFTSTWAQYRYMPEQNSTPTAFYAFGNCLALISFASDNPPYVVLHRSGPFAEAYKSSFEKIWVNAPHRPPNASEAHG
jgi:DNA-binding XRE family transcriptional regulator